MSKRHRPRKPDHISQEDWDAVDSPELGDKWFKQARPAREVVPDIVADYLRRKRGRPKSARVKVPVTVRIDPDALAALRATGRGWQTRLNEMVRRWAKRRKKHAA